MNARDDNQNAHVCVPASKHELRARAGNICCGVAHSTYQRNIKLKKKPPLAVLLF